MRFAKPEALASVPATGHCVIEASAGTGKTYTLEHLIIELILVRRIPIEQILVVTFTEKATGELVERVRSKLEEILGGHWESAPEGKPAWTIDAEARGLLERALFSFDTASISTIHAFCQRVLTEHAFAHRRLFEQTAVDEEQAFTAAFHDVLRRELARDEALRPYLAEWLTGRSVDDLERLLRACWRARAPLSPSFDPARLAAAIAGYRRAFRPDDPAVAASLQPVHASTRKAVLGRYAEIADAIGALPEGADTSATLRALEALDFAYLRGKAEVIEAAGGAAARLLAAALAVADALVPFEALVAQLFLGRVAARAAEQKLAAGQFDFNDMLSLVRDSLEGEHGDQLAGTLRRRYRAALIDEFQDTDDVQWTIFRRIFVAPLPGLPPAGGAAGTSDGDEAASTLFVIGDPKQAIYGFRGADVHTYASASKALGSPIPLTANYRSTPRLVEAYNEILRQSASEPFFDGKIRYEHPVSAGRADLVAIGSDDQALTPIHLLCPTSRGGKLYAEDAKRLLAQRIAREIKALLAPAGLGAPALRFGPALAPRPIAPREIFILTRSTSEGYLVGEALRAHGVGHAYYKQDGLFQRAEAAEVHDLLRAIAAPHERSRRLRAWLTPFFSLTLRQLDGLDELPATDPLVDRLFRWRAIAEQRDYARLFASILEDSGVVRRALFADDSERELTNYLHLFEILLEEAGRGHGTLDDLVRKLGSFIAESALPEGENGGVQRLESDREAVQIMSIHKSKGLEAAVVFVFGGFSAFDRSSVHVLHDAAGQRVAWVGPAAGAVAEAIKREGREEDQRLLYVALTRAKARLYLPYFRDVETVDPKAPKASKTSKTSTEKAGAATKRTEEFTRLDGCYKQLNTRLRALLAERDDPRIASLLSLEELVDDAREAASPVSAASVRDWQIPARLVEEPDERGAYERTRALHAGFVVTSYTSLKRTGGGGGSDGGPDGGFGGGFGGADDPDSGDREDLAVEADGAALPVAVEALSESVAAAEIETRAEALPGGKNTGNFLHSLLEEIPLESLAGAPTIDAWGRLPEVSEVFERNLGQYGIERRHLAESRRIVHTAFSSSVRLSGGALMPGLISAHPRLLREMEFLFPIPEREHPRLSDPVPGAPAGGIRRDRFRIERGYIRGFVDLVFEHRGLTYIADWKSDSLARWDRATVDGHVAEHYLLQAQFYSLALVKMLGAHDQASYDAKFGGFVYCFLRGMREGSGTDGIHFECPAWSTILDWEEKLLRADLLVGKTPGARSFGA